MPPLASSTVTGCVCAFGTYQCDIVNLGRGVGRWGLDLQFVEHFFRDCVMDHT